MEQNELREGKHIKRRGTGANKKIKHAAKLEHWGGGAALDHSKQRETRTTGTSLHYKVMKRGNTAVICDDHFYNRAINLNK